MPTTAYGSITIVDIGDLGELSGTPQSNQPIMVIYDPDSDSYSPNWGDSNLVLTPVVVLYKKVWNWVMKRNDQCDRTGV